MIGIYPGSIYLNEFFGFIWSTIKSNCQNENDHANINTCSILIKKILNYYLFFNVFNIRKFYCFFLLLLDMFVFKYFSHWPLHGFSLNLQNILFYRMVNVCIFTCLHLFTSHIIEILICVLKQFLFRFMSPLYFNVQVQT